MQRDELKKLLQQGNSDFWDRLAACTAETSDFSELFFLSSLRKKAKTKNIAPKTAPPKSVRVALIGGYSLYHFHELLEHLCDTAGHPCEFWLGDFDNYVSEIMDDDSRLYEFRPQVTLLMPAESRCRYQGSLTDDRVAQQAGAAQIVGSLHQLAARLHGKTGAEVIMTNFMLPARHDPGSFRTRTLGSDWSFRKWVNLELGLAAPSYVHICDLEFLASRKGGLLARDERAWFESKQPCSSVLLPDFAREVAHLIGRLRQAPKKVLVLDLDNTLWGGVVADDGLEGIEIGDTSPRGEAFKAFQRYLATLKQRGTLLAVCSKNDHEKAAAAFEKHPEMVLRLDDFVSFKANWEPKSENIRRMAVELNLGLDSFVFVDDNPAEVEIVRQFVPEVTTILLGPDPSEYVGQLQDCRLFEPLSLTAEDAVRTGQYLSDARRKALAETITDMDSYLGSLAMEAVINEFAPMDVPRLAQLINKSNQFNLTTRRRTEGEIQELMANPDCACFSVRLKDRFGDHGLISIIILQREGTVMKIDTWLMSCRVLKRQVEEIVLNEIVRLAGLRRCTRLEGVYRPTAKNDMVRDFYGRMGFTLMSDDIGSRVYELELDGKLPTPTKIKILRHAYEPS